MTDSFQSYVPANGKRRPRIAYDMEDSRVQVVEQLRQMFGYRNMNDAYLTALALGARLILQNEDPYAVVQRFVDLRPGKRNKSIKGRAKADAVAVSMPEVSARSDTAAPAVEKSQEGPQVVVPTLRGFAGRASDAQASPSALRSPLPTAPAVPEASQAAVQPPLPTRPGSSLAAHHFGLYGGDDLDEG